MVNKTKYLLHFKQMYEAEEKNILLDALSIMTRNQYERKHSDWILVILRHLMDVLQMSDFGHILSPQIRQSADVNLTCFPNWSRSNISPPSTDVQFYHNYISCKIQCFPKLKLYIQFTEWVIVLTFKPSSSQIVFHLKVKLWYSDTLSKYIL